MNETVESKNSETKKPARSVKGAGILGKAGCALGVFAICLAGATLWLQYDLSKQLSKDKARANKQTNHQLMLLNTSIQTIEVQKKQLADNVSRTDMLAKSLKHMQGSKEESWHLSEAEYLLRAANLQLQTKYDVPGAIRLLKQAYEVLGSINEYSLFSVKKGVEEDITALNGTSVVDVTGIWLQLNAASAQVETLPLLTPNGFDANKVLADSQSESVRTSEKPSGWLQHLERVLMDSWHFFSRQFYLRKHNETQSSLLVSAREEVQLRQNLQSMLTQAQQALLIPNETIYKQSIDDALRWIRVYFHNSSSEAKSLTAKLSYLSEKNIEPMMPVITHGLAALDAYHTQQVHMSDVDSEQRIKGVESKAAEHSSEASRSEKPKHDEALHMEKNQTLSSQEHQPVSDASVEGSMKSEPKTHSSDKDSGDKQTNDKHQEATKE